MNDTDRIMDRLDRVDASVAEVKQQIADLRAGDIAWIKAKMATHDVKQQQNAADIIKIENGNRRAMWYALSSVGSIITAVIIAVFVGLL